MLALFFSSCVFQKGTTSLFPRHSSRQFVEPLPNLELTQDTLSDANFIEKTRDFFLGADDLFQDSPSSERVIGNNEGVAVSGKINVDWRGHYDLANPQKIVLFSDDSFLNIAALDKVALSSSRIYFAKMKLSDRIYLASGILLTFVDTKGVLKIEGSFTGSSFFGVVKYTNTGETEQEWGKLNLIGDEVCQLFVCNF